MIQARNIDTSTFPTQRLTFSSKDTTMSGTTIVTYTAPEDGVYLISANVCFQRNGGENTELLLWSTRNGDSLGNIGAYVVNDNRRTPVSGTWIVNASKNDVIKVGATSVYGNIWTRSDFSEIYMTRIA